MKIKTIAASALALLLCLTLFALAACKQSDDSSFSVHPDADGWPDGMQATSAPADGSSADGSDGSGDVVVSLPGSGGSAVPDGADGAGQDDQTLKTFAGIIDSAGMGQYYVTSEDGQTIAFPHDGVDTTGLKDTRPGNPIVVYYTGTINGADISGITIVKMETP